MEADLYVARWDLSDPVLVATAVGTTYGGSGIALRGSLRLNDRSARAAEKVLRWALYEHEAFEQNLCKLLRRKTIIQVERAVHLTRKRLGRHVRPDTSVMTVFTKPALITPDDLIGLWARDCGASDSPAPPAAVR